MRLMMVSKATRDSEVGAMASKELTNAMRKYNKELVKSGALLDAGWTPVDEGQIGLRPFGEVPDLTHEHS